MRRARAEIVVDGDAGGVSGAGPGDSDMSVVGSVGIVGTEAVLEDVVHDDRGRARSDGSR
jgi:hypothetical protein